MKRFTVLFVIAIVCSSNVMQAQNKPPEKPSTQLNYDEPYNLIELLKPPDKTVILWQPTPLRPQSTYKLFLGTRMDFTFEKAVKNWAEKWNEKEGKKHGTVTIVTEIKQADVILARYQNLRELVEETVVNEPSMNPNGLANTVKTTIYARPQYSYLLLPKDDSLAIIWRQRKLFRQGDKPSQNTPSDLLSVLSKQLKKN